MTCDSCEHWKRQINPNDLAAEPQGECRGGPPAAQLVAANGGVVMLKVFYPTLPGSFPACAMHKEKPADMDADQSSLLLKGALGK